MQDYTITNASRLEADLMIEWAAKEGWNPGFHDAECFYNTDPTGFFVGKLNDTIIATGSAVIYDDAFAFCGFYIVDEAYRHQGYGLALTKARLAYVGERNAGLDGVIDMLDKYARLGYRVAHQNIRFEGARIPATNNECIVPLNTLEFKDIASYDRRHFPAPREAFLSCWINQPQATSLGYLQNNKLCGYGVIRACRVGYKIGPLFADNEIIAEALLQQLVTQMNGATFVIDVPANNAYALALVRKLQLKEVFATARMYLKGAPDLPMENIFGITSFELG